MRKLSTQLETTFYRLQEVTQGHKYTKQQRWDLNLHLLNFSAYAQYLLMYLLPWKGRRWRWYSHRGCHLLLNVYHEEKYNKRPEY